MWQKKELIDRFEKIQHDIGMLLIDINKDNSMNCERFDFLEMENKRLKELNESYESTIRTLTKNLLDKSGV